ncbi:M23 family metallopeptidase [Herbidospora sp. RD11066]
MIRSTVLRILSAAALLATSGVVVAATPALAAAPNLQLPFPCGQQWRLDTWAHAPALDMVKEPDQSGTDGATLIAPAAGTVKQSFFHSNAGNMIQIDHGGGYFTTYIHLQSRSVSVGTRVTQGQTIGRVGATGPTSNGHPHLHFELGFDANGDGSASWGTANSERVRPTFNGVTYGGGNNQTSRNVTSNNCGGGMTGQTSVYGALSDGRLTYTAIDAATNRRTHGAVTSSATLGFTPKAMATLNFNTILITDTSGKLYRVDVITNSNSLVFNPPVLLASSGWTHDLLAFDGGRLFGIAGGTLRRYVINAAKPAIGNITSNTLIDSGFTLKTLTATAPNWILGTTTGGELISYKINGAGSWDRYELRSSTWQVFDHLLSPGGGYYLGHHRDGSMTAYGDANPTDGNGSDISSRAQVDSGGWTQTLLSAWPGTVS